MIIAFKTATTLYYTSMMRAKNWGLTITVTTKNGDVFIFINTTRFLLAKHPLAWSLALWTAYCVFACQQVSQQSHTLSGYVALHEHVQMLRSRYARMLLMMAPTMLKPWFANYSRDGKLSPWESQNFNGPILIDCSIPQAIDPACCCFISMTKIRKLV